MHIRFVRVTYIPVIILKLCMGLFAGLIAEIVELDSASRVKCLFNLMEGKINLSIASEDFVLVT